MIDYASITPMMSLSTSIIGAALVEISEGMAEKGAKSSARKARKVIRINPSQRAVQRYYDERRAG